MSHISSLCNFYCARKGSGKTYDIGNQVEQLIDGNKTSQVYIFSSTAEIDPSWKRIIKMIKKADIPYEIYDGIYSRDMDERGREYKVNNLRNVLEDLLPKKEEKKGGSREKPPEEEYRFDPIRNVWIFRNSLVLPGNSFTPSIQGGVKQKKEKPKAVSPLFIFDDLSKRELRGVDLYNFIKKSRHYGQNGGVCYVYISSQFPLDISPEIWSNIDRLNIFRSFPDDYLKKIHSKTQLSIPYDDFIKQYKEKTAEQFSKMEIDMRKDEIL